MQKLKPVVRLLVWDVRDSLLIFWGILSAVTVLGILLAVTVVNGQFGMSGNMAVYIYMAITGFLMIRYNFPYLLGFNVTRQHYYWGMMISIAVLAAIQSLALAVYDGVFSQLAKWLGVGHKFHIFTFKTDQLFSNEWLSMLAIDFVLCLVAITFCVMVGSIHYRYGLLPLFALGLVGILLVMMPSVRSFLVSVIEWGVADPLPRLFILVMGFVVISFLLIWLMLRRATITPGGKNK